MASPPPRDLGYYADLMTKVIGALAAAAVFVYIAGGLVMAVRLREVGLPAEEIVPELPRDRLFAIGITQILWTVAAAAVFVALVWVLLWCRNALEAQPRSGHDWTKGGIWLIAITAALLLLAAALLAPWSLIGVVFAIALVVTMRVVDPSKGMRTGSRASTRRRKTKLPSIPPRLNRWQTAIWLLLLATALTVARQLEFPTPFGQGTVTIPAEVKDGQPPAPPNLIEGQFLAATDDEVFLGVDDESGESAEGQVGPSLMIVPRDAVAQIVVGEPSEPAATPDQSILDRFGPDLDITCLLPRCVTDSGDFQPPGS